jgi:hypothetical protein
MSAWSASRISDVSMNIQFCGCTSHSEPYLSAPVIREHCPVHSLRSQTEFALKEMREDGNEKRIHDIGKVIGAAVVEVADGVHFYFEHGINTPEASYALDTVIDTLRKKGCPAAWTGSKSYWPEKIHLLDHQAKIRRAIHECRTQIFGEMGEGDQNGQKFDHMTTDAVMRALGYEIP